MFSQQLLIEIQRWIDGVIREMKANTPRASSQLFQSIAPNIIVSDDGIKIQILMEDYWEEADLGVGKSENPQRDYPFVKKGIWEWIDVKPEVKAQIKAKGGDYKKNKAVATHFITKKIIEQGTKMPPSFFFSQVLGDMPLEPQSKRRHEITVPKGNGRWKEFQDIVGRLVSDSIGRELTENI